MTKTSKNKLQKFVQLGLRRNGRIVKNEQYSLEKFIALTTTYMPSGIFRIKPTLFNRLFRWRYLINVATAISTNSNNNNYRSKISRLIDKDNFGRKNETLYPLK